MEKTKVMSLVSANLLRGTFFLCSSKSKPRLLAAAKSVACSSKTGHRVNVLWPTLLAGSISLANPVHLQFPGGSPSEEELPSRPSRGPEWAPLEVPELPNTPEINPSETPPEVTTIPSDPPPLGPPSNPGPEFPVPPSPSPPLPDAPKTPTPETPPDVVPPNWEPPRPPDIYPPEIPPPGIDTPPPLGPTII